MSLLAWFGSTFDAGSPPPTPIEYQTLNFDGSSFLTSSNTLDVGTGDLSLECWVKFDSSGTGSNQMLMARVAGGGSDWQLFLLNSTGVIKMDFNVGPSSSWETNNAVNYKDDTLHHIVAVLERGAANALIYIDGVSIPVTGSGSIPTGSMAPTGELYIGNRQYGGTLRFKGDMAKAVVYHGALSASDVTNLYAAGSITQSWENQVTVRDLIAHAYNFNTGVADGRRYEDYSNNDNDLTVNGTPEFTGTSQTFTNDSNKFNSFGFDGSTKYANVPHDAAFNSNTISAGAWFKLNSLGSNQIIIAREDRNANATQAWALLVNSSNQLEVFCRRDTGFFAGIVDPATLTTGVWYFACMTVDGANLRLYKNGKLIGAPSPITSIISVSQDLTVGATIQAGLPVRYLNGSITEPFFYTRGITQDEVVFKYNQNTIKSFTALPSSLKSDLLVESVFSSQDSSGNDLTGNGYNFTLNGSISADGSEINFDSSN